MPRFKIDVTQNTFATVSPAFTATLKRMWAARYQKIKQDIEATPIDWRKHKEKETLLIRARLRKLCTNTAELDKELTRLRALPYTSFDIFQHATGLYLVGTTKPIVLDTPDYRRERLKKPVFLVYMPVNVFEKGADAEFHFVPKDYPTASARHPHHRAGMPDNAPIIDPLLSEPYTCWGSFGTIITSCIRDGDVVDIFRNIQVYLSRHNPASPLRDLSDCPAFV